jgi:hypothetical protein
MNVFFSGYVLQLLIFIEMFTANLPCGGIIRAFSSVGRHYPESRQLTIQSCFHLIGQNDVVYVLNFFIGQKKYLMTNTTIPFRAKPDRKS